MYTNRKNGFYSTTFDEHCEYRLHSLADKGKFTDLTTEEQDKYSDVLSKNADKIFQVTFDNDGKIESIKPPIQQENRIAFGKGRVAKLDTFQESLMEDPGAAGKGNFDLQR
jgi:hypothetical protein